MKLARRATERRASAPSSSTAPRTLSAPARVHRADHAPVARLGDAEVERRIRCGNARRQRIAAAEQKGPWTRLAEWVMPAIWSGDARSTGTEYVGASVGTSGMRAPPRSDAFTHDLRHRTTSEQPLHLEPETVLATRAGRFCNRVPVRAVARGTATPALGEVNAVGEIELVVGPEADMTVKAKRSRRGAVASVETSAHAFVGARSHAAASADARWTDYAVAASGSASAFVGAQVRARALGTLGTSREPWIQAEAMCGANAGLGAIVEGEASMSPRKCSVGATLGCTAGVGVAAGYRIQVNAEQVVGTCERLGRVWRAKRG